MPISSQREPDPRALAELRASLRETHGLALDGLTDAQLWQARLEAQRGEGQPPPADAVFEHLPISESAMFRNPALWAWLEDHWLPGALERAGREGRALSVLSLGCAQGQEVFSAAVLAARALRQRGVPSGSWPSRVALRGWDASSSRVALARSGAVSAWSVRGGKPQWLAELRPRAPEYEVPGTLRAMCRFEQHNLSALGPAARGALRGADLVLMQHVLVYFDAPAAARLVDDVCGALGEGALLVVAAVEAHLLLGRTAQVPGAPVGVTARRRAAPKPAGSSRAQAPLPGPSLAAAAPFAQGEASAPLAERLLTARSVLASDPPRGRALLAALVNECAEGARCADPGDAVSAEQVAQAARLLLGRAQP